MIECDCATTPKSVTNPLGICMACQRRVLHESAGRAPRRDWVHLFVHKALPWILSANTIVTTWLAGSLEPRAWAVGLVGQVGWFWWICATRTWGFLPMNIALWIVYARNHFAWTL